ncbi:MAG: hypothetical protein JWQ98_3351 [Chlorobi bacterium]|nr:hypothetical protein [Chlorobiota bacterium]
MKRITILAVMAFAIMLVSSIVSHAQSYTCIIVNGVKCYVNFDDKGNPIDTVCDDKSSGSGTFNSQTGAIPKEGAVKTELTPDNISATVTDPKLGVVTTSLDQSRRSDNTTINSVGRDRYPLDVHIKFYAEASVSSQPDTKYVSRTQLEFSSDKINSVDPFQNEILSLARDVEFYDSADRDQKTVFQLNAGSTTVTLGSRDADGGDVK